MWSTPLLGVFIEVVVDKSESTQANPWPTISGYRLVTDIGGLDSNVFFIEANEEAADTKFYMPGVANPYGDRYANVTFRVMDPASEA